jgi:hemin uptake protein HemP
MDTTLLPPTSQARQSRLDRPAMQGRRPPVIDAAALFGKQNELLIQHAGSLYRLRITQNNKLILTK